MAIVSTYKGGQDLSDATIIRDAMRALPSLAIASTGQPPLLEEIFFPESHAEVLDPEVSLVIGNRGMGKTFWSLALADKSLRPEIAARFLNTRPLKFDNFDVVLGFADAEGAKGLVSRANLESVARKIPPEIIWRTVLLRHLAPLVGEHIPGNFRDAVTWVRSHPDQQLEILKRVDEHLVTSGRRILFIFDQLDQLATGWERIQELTQGLLKTALAMKSYRTIKTKLFMRPDQAENKVLFRFPDASKILGGSRILNWRMTDLYGLLFFEILRIPNARPAFDAICKSAGIDSRAIHPRLLIPEALAGNFESQSEAFDEIAGSLMGRGTKRGRPYTWIATHLADGRGEISPRTFLKVMKTAAEWNSPPPESTAIDFNGIQEGVRQASGTRLAELEEDYPWVSTALEPLRGLLVPCLPDEIAVRWKKAETSKEITSNFSGASAPIDLVVAHMIGDNDSATMLIKLLSEIGVVEERDNGKINVPDIFRVKAGILRKGGVTPQQRRRLR